MLPASEFVTTHSGEGMIVVLLLVVLGSLLSAVIAAAFVLWRSRTVGATRRFVAAAALALGASAFSALPVSVAQGSCGGVPHAASAHGVAGTPGYDAAERFTAPCRHAGQMRLGLAGISVVASAVLLVSSVRTRQADSLE